MAWILQEIQEQPQVLEKTLRLERNSIERIHKLFARRKFGLVLLIARGTSDNAALFGRYLIEITTGHLTSLAAPSVHTLYRTRQDMRHVLAVGISQSGEGEDVNRTLEACRKQGAFSIGITNHPDSTMAGLVDEVLLTHAGTERSIAATKTYTAQMLMLYELARALGASFSRRSVEKLPSLVAKALALEPKVRRLVSRYRSMQRCLVVGRGLNYANAYEFALKLMETSYVTAERFSGADLLHGPIALVEKSYPVFVFYPEGVVRPGLEEVIRRLRKMKANLLLITHQRRPSQSGQKLVIPGDLPELWTPIPYIVPAQLFSALLAQAKGLDPDRPRYLQKVTRTI